MKTDNTPPPSNTAPGARDEHRREPSGTERVRSAPALLPLALKCLLAAALACVEHRRAAGPLMRRARREYLARRRPPAGWPNRATERTCVWLARDERRYRAVIEQVGNAGLGRRERGGVGADGEVEAGRQRLAEFFRVSVASHLKSSAEATRFIGCESLLDVDWPRVASWFFGHRVHPSDCKRG